MAEEEEEKSLCGYLISKPGGPFGRLKSSKRQFYYFDDSQCTLYYYRCEEDCRQRWRFPLGSIFIGESAIALSNEDSLQFAIHSEGKEHILRAESHRNMMTWALALQAKRDAWEKKRALAEEDGDHQAERPFNANDAPERGPSSVQDSGNEWKLPFSSKQSLQINGSAPGGMFRRMSIAKVNLTSGFPLASAFQQAGRERRRKSTFAEVGLLRNSDPPKRRAIRDDDESSEAMMREEEDDIGRSMSVSQPFLPSERMSPSKTTTSTIAATFFDHPSHLPNKCLEHPTDSSPLQTHSESVSAEEDATSCLSDTNDASTVRPSVPADRQASSDCDKYSSPETESASETDRVGCLLDEEEEEEEDRDMSGKTLGRVPILRLRRGTSDQPGRLLELEFQDENEDIEAKLQSELITVKCELTKCLNKENANRNALEEKETVLAEMRQKLAELTKKEQCVETEKVKKFRKLEEKNSMLQNQIKFLNDEILKLSRMLQLEQFKSHSKQLSIQDFRSDIDQLKRDYVFLLQSCIRLTCTDGSEKMELYMYGEKRHKQRVFALLEEARKANPSLPNIEGITTTLCHVDHLGFKHVFVDKSLILHYVCRQLHHHYSTLLRAYALHLTKWKQYLKRNLADPKQQYLQPTPDLKCLVRGGIPENIRSRVWCALYRVKVLDIRENKGSNYFATLCSMATETESLQHLEQHKRQISLDLLRTMPNNVHFCDRNSDGIKKMQDILNAFCLHNPKLGYCQGMNFLVGMMLLFMDAEDAFWCLVAIVERYFPPSYFDQNLIGAQADQEVLKDLLKSILPKISTHLAELDIELSTITLNWFLSIFIDSVPQETLLRIWDCFLLEGPKVLFRFSLAVLRLQEEAILAKKDTVSIMRQLKAAAKLCFDVEGLVSAAFEDLEPFPSRQEIAEKQASFFNSLYEKAKKKEREHQALRERERMMAQIELEGSHNHLIECAAVWGRDKVWVCHGHHHGSRVSMVNCQDNIMYRLHIEFESRVMCMHVPNDDTMLFGTFSHFVHAYHTMSRKKMWEIFLNSSVLSLCSHQRDGVKQVFAGLADGTLAVIENVQGRMPKPEVFYVVIGSGPVTCLQLVGRKLWCACGSNVVILSARTLDLLDQFQTSSNGLDYIFRMISGEQGVWVTLRGSSILQLWDPHSMTCRLLYDVRDNYCTRAMKMDEAYTNHARITSVLPFDNTILVGTADGTLIIYDVVAKKTPSGSLPSSPRPQPPVKAEPRASNAKQIQERLQKLFMEQEMMEHDTDRPRSITASPNLTPASNVSRRESSSEASSTNLDPNPEIPPQLGIEESTYRAGSPRRLEDTQEVDEVEESKPLEESVKGSADSATLSADASLGADRSKYYTKGFRKSSFTISTPIEEEESNSLQEGNHGKSSSSNFKMKIPTAEEKKPFSMTSEFLLKSEAPVTRPTGRRQSICSETPQTNRHNQAGDLLYTDFTRRSSIVSKNMMAVLDYRNTGYQLKRSKERYQSLSAEDIPTWVAQEKPEPIISDKGDVTFAYKSKLPSIKAFIKKEACELSNFLRASGALDKLGSDIDRAMQEQQERVTRQRALSGPFFSIRPPTLDLPDSQVWPQGLLSADQLPTPAAIEITVEGISDPSSQDAQQTAEQMDSRRSSASVQSLTQDEMMPNMASFLANDDDFLSTVQFNDLLQLQDWTRTSRKGSDTASNVSFGSNDVPFAFELVLKEKIKISDKPIRTLLQASCNGEPIIISCAGYYGDDEAVLKWNKEGGEEKLWTNDPVIEVCPYTHTIKPSPYARSRLPRRASIATTAINASAEIDGTFAGRSGANRTSSPSPAATAGILVESGLAKVQHLLSRVSDRT